MDLSFYKDKKVLVTGHTGFKGTWLCKMLVNAGAVVTGYSLEPQTNPDLFSISGLNGRMESVIADIRDLDRRRLSCIWLHSRSSAKVTGIHIIHMKQMSWAQSTLWSACG